MSESKTHPEFVGRRGELLAELFLQDLKPEFVAQAAGDVGYDFLVGFRNLRGGVKNIAVIVKATERLVRNQFPLQKRQYQRFAYSNIPVLCIVVNVKENRFFYTWISSDDALAFPESKMVMIRLTEIDESTTEELRKRLET